MTPGQLDDLSKFKLWDKAEHFLAFAVGAGNLALGLRWSARWSNARVALVSIAAISGFGAVDEIHQLFTVGRSGGDPFDWLADTLGAAAGVALILFIYARYSRPRRLPPAAA
jgi:VanZ family protein